MRYRKTTIIILVLASLQVLGVFSSGILGTGIPGTDRETEEIFVSLPGISSLISVVHTALTDQMETITDLSGLAARPLEKQRQPREKNGKRNPDGILTAGSGGLSPGGTGIRVDLFAGPDAGLLLSSPGQLPCLWILGFISLFRFRKLKDIHRLPRGSIDDMISGGKGSVLPHRVRPDGVFLFWMQRENGL